MKVGKHVIRTWSSTQATVATSSGEAELIAMYEGTCRGLALKTAMSEMSLQPQLKMIRVQTDSSVAKSFVATRGLGKMRHLEVKLLWLQECVHRGRLCVGKVSGTTNVADMLTKYHGREKLMELSRPHGIVMRCLADHAGTAGPRGGVEPCRMQ